MTEQSMTDSRPASEGCCCGDNASQCRGADSQQAPHHHNDADEGVREISKNRGADCCCGHDHSHEGESKAGGPAGHMTEGR